MPWLLKFVFYLQFQLRQFRQIEFISARFFALNTRTDILQVRQQLTTGRMASLSYNYLAIGVHGYSVKSILTLVVRVVILFILTGLYLVVKGVISLFIINGVSILIPKYPVQFLLLLKL